jgi:hypothetical protein
MDANLQKLANQLSKISCETQMEEKKSPEEVSTSAN